MHRIDGDGNLNGQFVPGEPGVGQEATVVTAEWLNAVQEEACAVIAHAGLALNKADNGQLLAALKQINGGGGIVLPEKWGLDAQEPVTDDEARRAIVYAAAKDAWAWSQFNPWRIDVAWRFKIDEALPSTAVAQVFDLRLAYLVVAAGAANPVAKNRWKAATAYTLGTYVIPQGLQLNGCYYECTTAGTSHATTQPTWPTIPGNTVADGTAVWNCRAGGFKPLVHATTPPNAAWQRFSIDHSDWNIPSADLSVGCTVHLGLWRRGSADSHTGSFEMVKARAVPVGV